MASTEDVSRRFPGLRPLATSLGSFNAQNNTPLSAISLTSSHFQSTHTPTSAIQPYNPQQWAQSSNSLANDSHASPLPPPPYSPPRSQPPTMSNLQEHTGPLISTPPPRLSMAAAHRPSPEPQTNFPPPPGAGGRTSSRDRRFGLPSLTRRRDQDYVRASPEPHNSNAFARQSMGPIIFRTPESDRRDEVFAAMTPVAPPGARRAVSTGALDTPTSARSRSDSQTRWGSGMAIPPPPPGPPPSSSRSQSVQPMDRNNVPIISPPTRRPPPSGIASLGPVPPTPAHWIDSDNPAPQPPRFRTPEPSEQVTAESSQARSQEEPVASSPGTGTLLRTGAVRHDKTILQRRADSRTRHSSSGSIDEITQRHLSSDSQTEPGPSSLTRKLTITKPNGRQTGSLVGDGPRSSHSAGLQDSRNSTPRATPHSARLPRLDTATPPFSPYPAKSNRAVSNLANAIPKALPTPPPHSHSASSSAPRDSSRPPTSSGPGITKQSVLNQSSAEFAAGAIERFSAFAEKEASSATDADRVRLFADFFVNESRIRRERYAAAIGAMGSEIFDLSRDLFRPMDYGRRSSIASRDNSVGPPNRWRRNSRETGQRSEEDTSSAPGSAQLPPSPNGGNNGTGAWNSAYMPSLSPILSMSVGENYENGSSRGRPPSRWWESDSQGESSRLMERSKRESKYMGVPKGQWLEEEPESGANGTPRFQGSSADYPREKVGWHEQADSSLTPQFGKPSDDSGRLTPSPTPYSKESLDVSRLVTLPPPYPRHHPAVNNNHPELTETRTSVRSLTDLSQIDSGKEAFVLNSSKRREDFAKEAAERLDAFKKNLQREISLGNLGFADAAVIEASTHEEENARRKNLEKSEYENFQNNVVVPLNQLLTERISRATDLFDHLARHLFNSNENDADMPQEEGDDKPELLEKLTLLKWIFEAREGLHRANYDLLSERNSRYCEVILTPYRLSGNDEKVKSAEVFFAEDAAKREFAFSHEVLERTRDFRPVVEEAVQRGVAIQLSAFWDIAPPLSRLLDSIPADLDGFIIQIPYSEYGENPSYHQHPLQYLFSLLLHAEKSTHQFIEAHTNLLCLLHEVKEAVVHAKVRYLSTQLEGADGTPIRLEEREEKAQSMRHSEDRRLTDDLKEKVRVVQDQWQNALGECLTGVKERTGQWLLETGGWDESLEDNGIGGV